MQAFAAKIITLWFFISAGLEASPLRPIPGLLIAPHSALEVTFEIEGQKVYLISPKGDRVLVRGYQANLMQSLYKRQGRWISSDFFKVAQISKLYAKVSDEQISSLSQFEGDKALTISTIIPSYETIYPKKETDYAETEGLVSLSQKPWLEPHVLQVHLLFLGGSNWERFLVIGEDKTSPEPSFLYAKASEVDAVLAGTSKTVEVFTGLEPYLFIAVRESARAYVEMGSSNGPSLDATLRNLTGVESEAFTLQNERTFKKTEHILAALRNRLEEVGMAKRSSKMDRFCGFFKWSF